MDDSFITTNDPDEGGLIPSVTNISVKVSPRINGDDEFFVNIGTYLMMS